MVTEVTDNPRNGYTPTDMMGNEIASYIELYDGSSPGDLMLYIPESEGSSTATLGTITFSFPEFPALVIREFEICGPATEVSFTVFTVKSGDQPFASETGLKPPILDAASQEQCKTYIVNVLDVTSIEITTDGYIRELAACLEYDLDNSQNAPKMVLPTVSPAPTMCPGSEPILVASEGGTMFEEGAPPIIITEQTGSTVTFQVVNTFEKSFTSYYVEYHNGGFGETECLQTENVEAFTQVATYTAECMVNVPISIVSIWIVDCDKAIFDPVVDNAEVPLCCEASADSTCSAVQYTFKLECIDPCPPDDKPAARRLFKKKQEEKNAASAEAFKLAAVNESKAAAANEPSADAKDGHFCVSEDYPCGEDSDRVLVCHYSARDGYRTFCVPEADSDVLAFYPKDYCGACIGGYGGSVN
jgi:hypothetical protein